MHLNFPVHLIKLHNIHYQDLLEIHKPQNNSHIILSYNNSVVVSDISLRRLNDIIICLCSGQTLFIRSILIKTKWLLEEKCIFNRSHFKFFFLAFSNSISFNSKNIFLFSEPTLKMRGMNLEVGFINSEMYSITFSLSSSQSVDFH